tara:strand:+ start:6134 stop:6298 length:165 start_codon:yes stop_codon:yes gene_type:complete
MIKTKKKLASKEIAKKTGVSPYKFTHGLLYFAESFGEPQWKAISLFAEACAAIH